MTKKIEILDTCCQVLGCTEKQIKGRQRSRPVSYYRHIIATELLMAGFSCMAVGHFLNRDHSTIIASRDRYGELYATWPQFRAWAEACGAAVQALMITEPVKIRIAI